MANSPNAESSIPPSAPIAPAAAAPRTSEDRFRDMVEALPIFVWTATSDGSITFASAQWQRYTGVEIRGDQGSTVHPDDRERTTAKWRHSVRTEAPYENEARYRRSDGEYRWFLSRANPVRDRMGKVESWFGTTTDIHDQKLTEAALHASEERFQLASQAVVGYLYDWDVATEHVLRFGGTEEVLGFPLSEIPTDADWWKSRMHPDDRALAVENARHWLRSDSSHFTNEYRILHKDGHYVRVSNRGRIVRDASGRAVRLLGGVTDVSERRHHEEEREQLFAALALERARLAEVFRVAPSFVAVYRGPDFVYEFVNEAYYRAARRRDLLGRPLLEVFPELRDQGIVDMLERVMHEGVPFVGRELRLEIRPHGGGPLQERFVDLSCIPIKESDGTCSGIVSHGMDVTAHVHAQREVERLLAESERMIRLEHEARDAAEAATRQRDHVLDVVAHELGNPLSAIGICARVLAEGDASAPINRTTIDLVERCVASMHRLIRDLTDVASIETGRLSLALRSETPSALLIAAAEMFSARARDAGVELKIHASADLPAVMADAGRVIQVLGNLLSNSLRHTPFGGRVTLHAERDPAGVRFAVEDTGEGIADEDLPHVFDRFWHKRPAALRGGGFGLPIVRGIVDAHGGTVDVKSTTGEGTLLTFTIPIAG